MMRRRDFIAGLGSATIGWPVAANAQQPAMPVIGYLSGRSREAETPFLAAFRKGLAEVGYVENRNVAFEFRFADGHIDRLPALAADLARRQPTVIVAVGGGNSAPLARAADPEVPIVFNAGNDPVQLGWVASFDRPTGNMTGVFGVVAELTLKNLSLLHELVPKASSVALLMGLTVQNPMLEREAREAAATLGLRLRVFNVRAESELEAAYAALLREPPDAMLLIGGPLHISRARQIAEFVARLGIPAIYNRRNYPDAGGLMSYGDNIGESYRYTGIYAGRVLKGEKPADLPVYQITKLELVINLKTAKAMNIAIPPTVLALADEVIE